MEYTIFEYNFETKKYKEVGYATAESSQKAREEYANETGWKKKKHTQLFEKECASIVKQKNLGVSVHERHIM